MFKLLKQKITDKNFPFFLVYFFFGIFLLLTFKKNIKFLSHPFDFLNKFLIFNIGKFLTNFLFFCYGYAAWTIPISFIFLSFLFLLKEEKIKKFFRIFGFFQIPFLFSFCCSHFSIRKNLIFVEGGIFGEYFKFLLKDNFYFFIKIFFFEVFFSIFQINGFLYLKDLFFKALNLIGFFNFINFGKNFLISFFFKIFPIFKFFFKNKDEEFFERCLKESLKNETNDLLEIFDIKNEEIGFEEKILPYKIIVPIKNIKKNDNEDFFEEKSSEIISIAKSFDIDLKFINFYKGPNVITSIFELALDIRLSKLLSMEIEFGRILGKPDLKIIYPLKDNPGNVGFQYSLSSRKAVNFMDYAFEKEFLEFDGNVSFLFGVDTKGNLKIYDLTKMPHLLVAGASGSGKSTFIHSCIMSIIWKYTSDYCKILLIDPKKIEYLFYSNADHLIKDIVTEINEIEETLKNLIIEMTKRFDLFAEKKSKNIFEYNSSKNEIEKLPYIIIFIDEYADIVIQSKDAEILILRLIQMGRAAGIHFVIATQRPSADIINGAIKANIPFRVAFKTSSSIDSRIIIGIDGAQGLLGSGDMLLIDQKGDLERVCGFYLSINDIETVISCVRKKKVCDKINV